ncbi:MAG: M13 family metallopeptidase [Erythrobacter sp.]|jgi:predicted metalloendopeptidase|nr:M13 family metallopeptidase [Erythrobacter sp.]
MKTLKLGALMAFLGLLVANAGNLPPRPQDDFYGHVNATWLATARIPPEVPWTGPFVENTLAIQAEVAAIIEDLTERPSDFGPVGAQIAAYRQSLMAEDRSAGIRSLERVLRDIAEIEDKKSLVRAFCRLHADHSDFDPNAMQPGVTPIWLGSRSLPSDAARQALFVEPAGLGLPDAAYYVEPRHDTVRSAYLAMMADLMGELSIAATQSELMDVFDLEAALAQARLSEADRHDAASTWSFGRNHSGSGQSFDWSEFFAGCNLDPNEWLVADTGYFAALFEAIESRSTKTWRNYLGWQVIRRYAPVLSDGTRAAHFGFYGGVLLGNAEPRTSEEAAALSIEAAFGAEIEKIWLNRHFDPRIRGKVRSLAEDIRSAYGRRIARSDMFSEQTKAEALRKLERLTIQLGHPDEYDPSSPTKLLPSDVVTNLMALRRASFAQEVAEAGRPRDRSKWYAPAYDTSAYYVRSTNTLAIPAGMLRAPWFDVDAAGVENFAGIGSIIAHEMAHAFDDQGSQYDADGVLMVWWTTEDRKRFDDEISKIIEQYSAFEALPGLRLDGRLTVSEAYADLAGLIVAHQAMLASLGNPNESGKRAATSAYLAANCRMKRAIYRTQLLERIVATESHAPARQRCNGPVSAFEPFYDAFEVGKDDEMYVAEDNRASPL